MLLLDARRRSRRCDRITRQTKPKAHLPMKREQQNRVALLERLLPRIQIQESGCWIWTGAKSHGYGVLRIRRKNILVHRLMWELGNDRKIPGDLEPHHKCETSDCVRPSHLAIITHKQNILLSDCPAAKNSKKAQCSKGHRFTTENTLMYLRRRGKRTSWERICRACSHRRRERCA